MLAVLRTADTAMTQTATQLLYEAAGQQPDLPGLVPCAGPCFLCGGSAVRRTAKVLGRPAVLPKTFMDYDKAQAPDSGHICAACWFSMEERSELLAARVGKGKPQRMRNYSHFVLRGEWHPLSKGDKRGMYEILLQRPALAVVAVSGQKHLLFRAQPGRWQVEENSLLPDPLGLTALMAPLRDLYDGGFSKAELGSGQYATWRIVRYGLADWQMAEAELRAARGSALFELALFLLQRSEGEDGTNGEREDAGDGLGTGLGAVAGDEPRVQEALCAGHLGPVPEPSPRRGDGHQQPGHVRQRRLL